MDQGVRALHSYIYAGVTSVYDAGNVPDYILGLRSAERSGELVSPRIFATGGIVTYPDSHGSSEGATLVDSWPEAIPAIDAHIARKPDVLKLTFEERGWGSRPMISLLPVDLMQRIIHYYNDRGIRTTVHTSSEYRARQAIFAGVDTIAHPVIQGPITDDFARLMGAKKIPMVTTLTIGDGYSRLAEHPEYLDQPLYRASLTAEEIETLKTERRREYQARKWTAWMQIMTSIAQENLRKINEAGGVLVAGTDQSTGPDLHRELELLADAGIPAMDLIRIATLNGAVFLGREDDLGSIEVGKLADLVLLNASPLDDIRNASNVAEVIKNGRVIDRSELNLPVNRRTRE
jgi:imidazolonepropionase-like amidohydrolase